MIRHLLASFSYNNFFIYIEFPDLSPFSFSTDGGQPNIKVFYLDLEFINDYGEAIVTSWKQHGRSIGQVVPPKGEAFTENALAAFQAPAPVYIEAKIGANNETVMVNGQLVFPVVYTEYLKKNVIRFGDGRSFLCFFFV